MMQFYNNESLFSIEQHTGNSILTGNHFHSVYEFYLLEEGNVSLFIDNKIYELEKGDLIFIPPQTIHNTFSTSNTIRKRTLFYLQPRFLSPLDCEELIPWTTLKLFHTSSQKRIHTIYKELLDEFNGENNQIYTKALLCELLVLIKRLKPLPSNELDGIPSKFLDVVTYINSNYNQRISLKSIAKYFYINPTYLSRVFKHSTGMNFSEYLNKCRIKNANILLTETNKKIAEIANLCGYNSVNHFCKMYKQIIGCSPKEYRKRYNFQ